MYSRAARLVREQKVGKGWRCSRWERAGRRRRGGVWALGARERKKNRRKREGGKRRGVGTASAFSFGRERKRERREAVPKEGEALRWISERRGRERTREKDRRGTSGQCACIAVSFHSGVKAKKARRYRGYSLRGIEMTGAYYNCPFVSRYPHVRWKHEKHLLLETRGADNSAVL